MISIIIIGKNEGGKLIKCLESVSNLIHSNKEILFEVIYIDSNSTDNSIVNARNFGDNIRIYKINGKTNAAIARNIGAKEAKGDVLFFLDGDMEVNITFLNHAVSNGQLTYDVVTGHINDYIYNDEGIFQRVKLRTYKENIPVELQIINTLGGVFLIKKRIWNTIGGMRTKYKLNEDFDISFRLRKNKIKLVRLPYLIVNHHTFEYLGIKEMTKTLFCGKIFYPAMLFREHFLLHFIWKHAIRSNYSAILLFISLVFFAIRVNYGVVFLFLYCIVIIIRTFFNMRTNVSRENNIIYFICRLVYHITNDISFWLGFFFFHPKNHKLKYEKV